MFKIIALEILEKPQHLSNIAVARYKSIHKILKQRELFMFYNNFNIESTTDSPYFDIHLKESSIPNDFFCKNFIEREGNGKLNVNICAIVGANGSGKSSVFELLIRMINNVSYAILGNKKHAIASNILHFIDNIYARFYFQGSKVLIYKNKTSKSIFEWNKGQRAQSRERVVKLFGDLFYTIVVNYSNYSYNIYDLRAEWDEEINRNKKGIPLSDDEQCWINGIFHKNDSYKTPIVLNPFRDHGLIDYNNEKLLSRDRLFLLILQKNTKGDSPFKEVLDGKDVFSFLFDISLAQETLPKGPHATRGILDLFDYFKIEPSEKNISSLFNSIIAEWGNCYGIDLLQANPQNKDRKDALNYLFYKTLKIVKNYDDFHQYEDNIKNNINVNLLIRALFKERSHITTKVRRTIAFLIFNHYGTFGQCPKSNLSETSKYEVTIDDFSINMEEKLNRQTEIITELSKKTPSKKVYNTNYVWKKEDMLPSPFLNTTLYLKHINGDKTTFDSLSSGEKQIVYSLSTILYHLKNIDSVWDVDDDSENKEGIRVKYKYINLMLDEIELYFHPLYQKKYINYLLKSLSNLDLQNIEGLNLILSTHSPFILSDLPDSNILYIENGKMKEDQLRMPFGANIYDILNQSFFMDSFVGEFSVEKMQSILNNIESSTVITKEKYEEYNNIINMIGDALIRNKMQLFLDEHFYKDEKRRKQREVERLQKRIDKINESM